MKIDRYYDEDYLEKLEVEDENERFKNKYKKKSKKLKEIKVDEIDK